MKELNADNYGFENINSKYYPQLSYFNSAGSSGQSWTTDYAFANSFTGKAYYTDEIEASLYVQPWALLYKKIRIGYLTSTVASFIRVEVNGTVVETISVPATDTPEQRFTSYYSFPEWGAKGNARIRLYNAAGRLTINGYDFINNEDDIKLDNLSHFGRRTQDLSEKVISDVLETYDVIIWSLGFNDQGASEFGSDYNQIMANLEHLKTYAIANNKPIIFVDFIWGKPNTHFYRAKIKDLSSEIPNSIYISFPEIIKLDGSISTATERDDIGLTVDGTHLSDDFGNLWVATHIANCLGIKVSKDYKFDTDIVLSTANALSRIARLPRDWGSFSGSDPFASKVAGFAVDKDIYTDISLSPPSKKYYVGSTNTWTVF